MLRSPIVPSPTHFSSSHFAQQNRNSSLTSGHRQKAIEDQFIPSSAVKKPPHFGAVHELVNPKYHPEFKNTNHDETTYYTKHRQILQPTVVDLDKPEGDPKRYFNKPYGLTRDELRRAKEFWDEEQDTPEKKRAFDLFGKECVDKAIKCTTDNVAAHIPVELMPPQTAVRQTEVRKRKQSDSELMPPPPTPTKKTKELKK